MSYPASVAQSLRQSRKHSAKRKTVHVTLWVKPEIKAELQRLASTEGLSVSKFGGVLLTEAIHQKLHIQHAVLLQTILEQAIHKAMARFTDLQARNLYEAGWTRRIASNILKYSSGMTEEKLNIILDRSSIDARKHIFRETPQTVEVIEAARMKLQGEENS